MADPKDQRQDQRQGQDQPRHGRDVTGKDDPARTRPYQFNEPRPQADIVAQAYDHEDPTPTQEENDQAKLDAIHVPDGGGDPQMQAAAKRKREQEAQRQKDMEAQRGQPGQGYQTRATPKAE